MRNRKQPHTDRRWPSAIPWVLLVGVLTFALAAWLFDLGSVLGVRGARPEAPQPQLLLTKAGDPTPVAAPAHGPEADPKKVETALKAILSDKSIGPNIGVAVIDLSSGKSVLRRGPETLAPASTMKLLTSTAALHVLGPDHRFTTSVLRRDNEIFLRGGGDPMLTAKRSKSYPTRASLADLADQVAKALGRGQKVRLAYDASLFSGPTTSPTWPPGYLGGGVVPRISALWDDEAHIGGGYVADPPKDAAVDFARLLRSRGVRVVGQPRAAKTPEQATVLGEVQSPPLSWIVTHLLMVSDNNAAEVVAHQVGLAKAKSGSFDGGAQAVRDALRELKVPLAGARIFDGSGLSRSNRLAPETLAAVLHLAATDPQLRSVITGMPVAGYTGSLATRFDRGAHAGQGRVQAKTGTLTGVHALAGVVNDMQGTVFGLVIMADRVPAPQQEVARIHIDQAFAALAACSCGVGTP